MDLKEIYALVDLLVDEKLRDINMPQGKKGLRGPRGFDGKDGSDGVDGKSFDWSEHEPTIVQKIQEHKLKFSDLSDDEVRSLRGPRGQRGKQGIEGPKGEDGKSFSFDEHAKEVEQILLNNKENFQGEKGEKGDIGPRGLRGLSGRDGKDGESFEWDKYKDEIFNRIDKNKLTFDQLNDDDKKSLRGERGLRGFKGATGRDGLDGKDFIWEDHQEKIFDRIDKNKLTFSSLSDVDKNELKGERGPRGQRGRAGLNGLSAYEIWLENNNEGTELDFLMSLKGQDGKDGKNGINGLNGLRGIAGSNGSNGKDGEDAPIIIDIQLKDERGKFYFVFYLSDGSRIETKSVTKPAIESIIQNTYVSKSGGSGGGAAELEIYKDNVLLGIANELDFVGDNITVDYLDGRATIQVEGSCLGIYDEGNEVTDCAKTIDFIGDAVEVVSGTVISDWSTLTEVTSMANYTVGNTENVKVVINGLESVSKLGLIKEAAEPINQFDIVRLVSSELVAKGSSNSSSEAKVQGIAMNSGDTGDDINFIMFGVIEDPAFSFPLLAKLFLSTTGTITTTPPIASGQYVVSLGESLGTGAIFIKIEEPEAIV